MLVILTGFIASVAHVVTGPDHLAAVTPLAIDSRKRSWMVGLGWGLGHTVGMLMIGGLFILFREYLPVEMISKHSETIIGLMLIGIGGYAVARIYRNHSHGNRAHGHFHHTPHLYAHIHRHTHADTPLHQEGIPDHDHDSPRPGRHHALTALGIGVVHGFAGFSHLFALLPSLALPSVMATVLYVCAFAAGTISTMVLFAFLLGQLAHRAGKSPDTSLLKWFTLSGGILAIAVGVLWLVHPF